VSTVTSNAVEGFRMQLSTGRRPAAAGLLAREARADVLRLLRTPGALVPMVLLPWAFYSFFAIVLVQGGPGQAAYLLATYGVFAALAPCLFGFGAGIAHDRDSGTLLLKQVSPLPGGLFLLARLVTAAVFTLIVLAGLYALALFAAGVRLPPLAWPAMLAAHLGGVPPLCLIGLAVGLRAHSSAAIAITNLLLFALAVLSGLWVPLFLFPPILQELAQLLPTTHLAALALAAIGRDAGGPYMGAGAHVAILAGFTAALGLLAWRGWMTRGR
jgi:ABC-2 type transport system permease protein